MYTINTEHPVALDSYDHIHPFGTIRDNNSNTKLIQKFKALQMRYVMDIGCAGGAFVEELLANGIQAVGIEGSDINLKTKRAAWATIPNNLFTADATKPFEILVGGYPTRFDVVTAWEFFEHIEALDIPRVLENIWFHTSPGSQLICSISNFPSPHDGVDLHRTQEDLQFWLNWFSVYDFFRDPVAEGFYDGNWVRHGTYNLVLTKS